jgi:hypothetical protein
MAQTLTYRGGSAVKTSFLLAADLHAEVEQACERDDVSQSQLFRAAVKHELDRRARITAAQELADAAAPRDADA